MIFSELYSAYYNAVSAIIRKAIDHPLDEKELRAIVSRYAFGESTLSIPSALREEKWQLLKADGTTIIKNEPSMPLTLLQKRWLKSIAMDPRIRLFGESEWDDPEVEPLFLPEDYLVFDKYSDGDDYEDAAYIANFRLILDAIRNQYPLYIEIKNRKGNPVSNVVMPGVLGVF